MSAAIRSVLWRRCPERRHRAQTESRKERDEVGPLCSRVCGHIEYARPPCPRNAVYGGSSGRGVTAPTTSAALSTGGLATMLDVDDEGGEIGAHARTSAPP